MGDGCWVLGDGCWDYYIIMVEIHIFNPETDYALAAGRSIYNAPRRIVDFRKRMCLFPATYAADGDWIVIDDDASDLDPTHLEIAKEKNLQILPLSALADRLSTTAPSQLTPHSLRPWGWNHTLLAQLTKAGVAEKFLKTDAWIDRLRELSHRRTAIVMQQRLSELLPDIDVAIAREFTSADEALDVLDNHQPSPITHHPSAFSQQPSPTSHQPSATSHQPSAYFKLPWSSSGRGVILSSTLSPEKLRQWIEGGIRKQGSVIGERAFNRKGDFATEWEIKDGRAEFLGLSVFRTTAEGRYVGNIMEPQESLWERIAVMTPDWSQRIIEAQRTALEETIAPDYSGPAGIDMLADTDRRLNPCVEVNLRQTMGMAALLSYQQTQKQI